MKTSNELKIQKRMTLLCQITNLTITKHLSKQKKYKNCSNRSILMSQFLHLSGFELGRPNIP